MTGHAESEQLIGETFRKICNRWAPAIGSVWDVRTASLTPSASEVSLERIAKVFSGASASSVHAPAVRDPCHRRGLRRRPRYGPYKTATTTNGEKIAYPATDAPEVTALLVEIPAGGETGWHLHPVPVYAYVLSGTLSVEMAQGERYTFNAGDAIIETVDRAHNGKTVGATPVKLAVFYMGVQGRPIAVKAAPSQAVAPGQ